MKKSSEITGLLLGIIFVVLGIIICIYPATFANFISIFIGVVFITVGIILFLVGFSLSKFIFSFLWNAILGILLASFGIVFCVNSDVLFNVLRIFLFVYLLIDGLYKIINSFAFIKAKIKLWFISLILGIIYLILAFSLFYGLENFKDNVAIFAAILFIITGTSFMIDNLVKIFINKPIKEERFKNSIEVEDKKEETKENVIEGEIIDENEDRK